MIVNRKSDSTFSAVKEFKVSAQDAPWPRDVKTDRKDFACLRPPCGLLKLGSCLKGI